VKVGKRQVAANSQAKLGKLYLTIVILVVIDRICILAQTNKSLNVAANMFDQVIYLMLTVKFYFSYLKQGWRMVTRTPLIQQVFRAHTCHFYISVTCASEIYSAWYANVALHSMAF